MKDAEKSAQKRRIRRLTNKWRVQLGLGPWSISMHYEDDGADFKGVAFGPGQIAACEADWRYLFANISWNLPTVQKYDDDELQGHVIHELLHCVIDEIARDAKEAGHDNNVERVTTSLERAMQWAYKLGLKEGRRAVKA
jgi:hypothetical protein